MSAKRWALSAFFVWHIASTVLGRARVVKHGAASCCVPPVTLKPTSWPRPSRPSLIELRVRGSAHSSGAGSAAGPMRGVFDAYLGLTGLGQNWQMFSAPPKVHQYLRARYT